MADRCTSQTLFSIYMKLKIIELSIKVFSTPQKGNEARYDLNGETRAKNIYIQQECPKTFANFLYEMKISGHAIINQLFA